ncbi:MAG: hypothetical protein GXP62_16765 [Oligoflexia bacterium]|nr:hypothetical protein [Oligoflexia bacterium]
MSVDPDPLRSTVAALADRAGCQDWIFGPCAHLDDLRCDPDATLQAGRVGGSVAQGRPQDVGQ